MPAFERSTEFVRTCVTEGMMPGAALAIGFGEEVLVRECFGKVSILPGAGNVNPSTAYDMASCSKIMSTTMLALRAIAAGKIDLADALPRFFGSRVPADKAGINLFQLMTHTSGLPSHILLSDCIPDAAGALDCILAAPLSHPVGTTVEYSCMGFILLGKVLETVLGAPLDILFTREVAAPLGLRNTGYHPLDRPVSAANTAYTERCIYDGEWLVGRVHDENCFFLNGVAGNAGIFSDLDDCTRFARMLAGHGNLEGRVYLPRVIFDAAIRNYTPGQEQHRGLGFHLANGYDSMSGAFFSQAGFGHNGFTGPHIFVDPETGLWVCLLTNRVHPTRENTTHLRLRRVLHTLMVQEAEARGWR